MAEKKFYHDIVGLGSSQLKGIRVENVADATAQSALESTGNNGSPLGADNVGYHIFRVDLSQPAYWDGTQFVFISGGGGSTPITGDVIFKGFINASLAIDSASQPQTVEPVSGYQYVVNTAGTFNPGATGVALSGVQELQVGDQILFTSATQAFAIQRNDASATETTEGNVRIATQAEVDAGDAGGDAASVTPETLESKLAAYPVSFTTVLSLTGDSTPDTVTHNLGLVNKDAFTINFMQNGSQISVEVSSVDVNTITVASLLPLADVTVTIVGIKG